MPSPLVTNTEIDTDLAAIAVEVHELFRLAGSSSVQEPIPPKRVLSLLPSEPEVRNSIGMEFVLIPAGEFLMGSIDRLEEERPVHKVQISQPFYLGKYAVTQAEWEAVMGNDPSRFKGILTGPWRWSPGRM